MTFMGCPHCVAHTSFTLLEIEGYQQKARYAQDDDGDTVLTDAETVTVTGYNEDRIQCGSCGQIMREDDLVEVEG